MQACLVCMPSRDLLVAFIIEKGLGESLTLSEGALRGCGEQHLSQCPCKGQKDITLATSQHLAVCKFNWAGEGSNGWVMVDAQNDCNL